MNDKRMVMYDGTNTHDTASVDASSYTAFKTDIIGRNIDTGEIIFKTRNKVILPGSGFIARKLFDIDTSEVTPSYNEAFGASMYTPELDIIPDLPNTAATKSNQKVVLFCCGTDGCGTENSQIYPVDYRKWIAPQDLVPFRFQLANNDLSDELRETYFGRTSVNNGEYLAYYFKRFEREVKLVQQYVDGTPVSGNIYDSVSDIEAETYVEIALRISKEDIRDYFIATVGIDEAKINSISLCTGYPVSDADGYMYFKDIRPITKLNIPNEQLIDTTKGIEIIYHIYM